MPPSSHYDRNRPPYSNGGERSDHPNKRQRESYNNGDAYNQRSGGRYENTNTTQNGASRDMDSRGWVVGNGSSNYQSRTIDGNRSGEGRKREYSGASEPTGRAPPPSSSSATYRSNESQRVNSKVRFADSSESSRAHVGNFEQHETLKDDSEIDYELQTEEDQARLIEERRKRRQAILLKHQSDERAKHSADTPSMEDLQAPEKEPAKSHTALSRADSGKDSPSIEERNFEIDLEKKSEHSHADQSKQKGFDSKGEGEGISAAEYDPSVDRALDDERAREHEHQMNRKPSEEVTTAGVAAGVGEAKERMEEAGDESEYEEVEVDEEDDVDDMFSFGDDDGGDQEKRKKKVIRVKKGQSLPAPVQSTSSALNDNWDDADGYYRIILGERLGEKGRFQVFANLGRGMFSSVVKARDMMHDEKEVAIKIVRRQETMYKAGLKEMSILEKLAKMDPEDKRHIIRLEGHFQHRNHLCMVFESKSMNLREVVKRFGKDVGLNLRAVRAYAHQMFLALSLMRKADIMHADIKPDNILVNETKSVLKICDLGSASDLSEMEITPYLVSRFYRAPEIILGLPYDCAIDMWSIGCTLYEVYTGQILFPGRSNNQMLLLHQELRGAKFTTKQIRKAKFSAQHFDEQNNFLSISTVEKAAGLPLVRKVPQFTGGDGVLKERLLPANATRGLSDADIKLTNLFIDLMTKMLDLDATRRITAHQALQHAFFTTS